MKTNFKQRNLLAYRYIIIVSDIKNVASWLSQEGIGVSDEGGYEYIFDTHL